LRINKQIKITPEVTDWVAGAGGGREGGGGQEMKEKENTTGFYLLIDNMVALKKADWFLV
jgi:hypothetical protein